MEISVDDNIISNNDISMSDGGISVGDVITDSYILIK